MRHVYLIIFTIWITASYAQEGRVCIYEHPNYKGWEQCFTEDQANFKYLGINDEVSSLRIFGGIQVKLYQNAHYQGMGYLYTENIPWVGDEVNDQFSSLQIISSVQNQVCLYEHPNYQGIERCFAEDQIDFASLGINDRISSLRIFGPLEVNLFQHARYRGFRQVYTENTPWVGKNMDEQFSSLQILKKRPSKSFRRNDSPHEYNKSWTKPPPQRDGNEEDRYDGNEPNKGDTFRHRHPRQEEEQRDRNYKRLPHPESSNDQQKKQGYFRLHNHSKCLAVTNSYERGAPVQAWPCRPITTQSWKWDNGRLINHGGKCLDADSASMSINGGKIQIWECHNRANQQWSFNQGRLVNQGSGKCLDLHEGDLDQEVGKIQLWDCHLRANQQWEMIYR